MERRTWRLVTRHMSHVTCHVSLLLTVWWKPGCLKAMESFVAGGPHIWEEVYVMLWKGSTVVAAEGREEGAYVTEEETLERVV